VGITCYLCEFCQLTGRLIPRFPARHEVPEFTVFASLLRMATKYDLSNVRDQLIKDIKGAYPTKREAYEAGEVLGEDVFGSPTPHPNAVLNLFLEQSVRIALPFAFYRASVGGFSAIVSDKPGTVLPRHVLATTINGMHLVGGFMNNIARLILYEIDLGVCDDGECVLSAAIIPVEQRVEALRKLGEMFLAKRDGGELGPLSLGHLTCAECTTFIQASYVGGRSLCWERLPGMFSVAQSWDDV